MPAGNGGKTKSRSACAHAGCTNKVRVGVGIAKVRVINCHFCCECQRFFCAAHTRVASHAYGDCGVESRCVCVECFAYMDAARQASVSRLARPSKQRLPGSSSNTSLEALAIPSASNGGGNGAALQEAAAAGGSSGGGNGSTKPKGGFRGLLSKRATNGS